MSYDYSEIAAEATEAIREYGMELRLRSANGADIYDPVSGEYTGTVPPGAETPFNGVRLNIDTGYAQKIGTQNINLQDELVYMEPNAVTPNLSSQVLIDGGWWDVVRVEKVAPANVPVLFILQVRP